MKLLSGHTFAKKENRAQANFIGRHSTSFAGRGVHQNTSGEDGFTDNRPEFAAQAAIQKLMGPTPVAPLQRHPSTGTGRGTARAEQSVAPLQRHPSTPNSPGTIQKGKDDKDDGKKEPPLPRPRQLHIFVNLEGIPANRVMVFLQHFIGRLQASGGRGTALNIAPGEEGLETQDISTSTSLTVGEPEEKNKQKNKKEKVEKLRRQVSGKHQSTYRPLLDPLDKEPGKYDEIVVIGVAMPAGKADEKNLYASYANVSGIADIPGLSTEIRNIIAQNLKDGGHLRVQLCHAGAVKVDEHQTFGESLMPEKKEMTISAPQNFSVIGDEGDFVDLNTKMGIFDQNKGSIRTYLLGKAKGETPLKEELAAREAEFRSNLKGKDSVSKQITELRFGNIATKDGPVVNPEDSNGAAAKGGESSSSDSGAGIRIEAGEGGSGPVNFVSSGTVYITRRPVIGFYLLEPVADALESGVLEIGKIFRINGVEFRIHENSQTGELAMFLALRGG